MRKQFITAISLILFYPCVAFSDDATIGTHKDGVSYTILSKERIVKAEVYGCGRTDLGAPILGIFERQNRQYTERKNNQVVKTWTKVIDVFIECKGI